MAYNSIPVKVRDKIKTGQKIGYMRNTGHTLGGHLHFEVRLNISWTSRIDPAPYFNKDLSVTLQPVVSIDINNDQIEVVVSDLNIRSKPNTSCEMVYYHAWRVYVILLKLLMDGIKLKRTCGLMKFV